MEVYQGGQKILPSLFGLGVSGTRRNSVEGCGDCKAQTVLLADTLSLRVARSGTKRPASARLGAKNRRAPQGLPAELPVLRNPRYVYERVSLWLTGRFLPNPKKKLLNHPMMKFFLKSQ